MDQSLKRKLDMHFPYLNPDSTVSVLDKPIDITYKIYTFQNGFLNIVYMPACF